MTASKKPKFNIKLPPYHDWQPESADWEHKYDFRWECTACKAEYFIGVDENGEVVTELKKFARPLCTAPTEEKVAATVEAKEVGTDANGYPMDEWD